MVSPRFEDPCIDAALEYVADNASKVDVCTSDPASYAAISGVTVANYTLTTGVAGADWDKANGDTSGRKLTMTQQTGNNGTGTGAANFLVFNNNVDTIYAVIDGDGDTVNSGSAVTINAVDVWEIRDPT